VPTFTRYLTTSNNGDLNLLNLLYDSIIKINKTAVGVLMPMSDDNSYRVYSYVFQIVVSYLMYQRSPRLWHGTTTVSPPANNNYYYH